MLAKKKGANTLVTISWIATDVRLRRCVESPIAIPAINAPKTAWMPAYSVKAAALRVRVKMKPNIPPGHVVWAWTNGSSLSISQRPTVSINPTNISTSTMVCLMPPRERAAGFINPRTKENKIHPTRSSNMADDMITVPISVRRRLRSIRILAITGRAEIERAVPTNRAKIRRSAPTSAPRYLGKISAAAKPNANGKITPKKLTKSALLPWRKMLLRLISRPAVSRKNTTPRVATVSSTMGIGPVLGNNAAYIPGR